jgi:hypothetical protein
MVLGYFLQYSFYNSRHTFQRVHFSAMVRISSVQEEVYHNLSSYCLHVV